jgi:hypothetical protein
VRCDLFTPTDDQQRCLWCSSPRDSHRFVACPHCGGHPFIADPRWKGDPDAYDRDWILCRCVTKGNHGGWLVRATGRPATDRELRTVGWQPPGG